MVNVSISTRINGLICALVMVIVYILSYFYQIIESIELVLFILMQTNMTMRTINGQSIRQRSSDGYLSATDICKAGGKLFGHYNENAKTREYITALTIEVNIPIVNLIESRKGGILTEQGTWVHPQVATHLAMWISPKFAVKVTRWIEEWKTYSSNNKTQYMHEINHLEPSNNSQIEAQVRDLLAREYHGTTEVQCSAGIIDIVTHQYVIEVKIIYKWKHALGQAQAYSMDMNLEPAVYLFMIDDNNNIIETSEDKLMQIRPYFKRFNVILLNDLYRHLTSNIPK